MLNMFMGAAIATAVLVTFIVFMTKRSDKMIELLRAETKEHILNIREDIARRLNKD